MFKKCKENQCLNREMIDFMARQLILLKDIATKATDTSPQIVADQLRDCIQLIDKRIIFALDGKPSQQFHDYVSDFYEDKLDQLRNQLNKELMRSRQAEAKIDELTRQLRNKQEVMMKSRPSDLAAVGENVQLRNELLHSQKLIRQNQTMMEEQNRVIGELNEYVQRIEEREKQSRLKFDEKIKQLDDFINNKKKTLLETSKSYEVENKKQQREWRQLELRNASLHEEKQKLESEVMIKSEQIKLLTRKVYDQQLVISKFQRTVEHTEEVLLEEKIEGNRVFDENRALKEKIREIQRDYEGRIQLKFREVRQLQERNNKLSINIKELELNQSKYKESFEKISTQTKVKIVEARNLQSELNEMEQRCRQYEKEIKKLQRKDKDNLIRFNQLEEQLQEKEQQLKRYKQTIARMKKDQEIAVQSYERQKLVIKEDLMAEFKILSDLNKSIIEALQKREFSESQLTKENQKLTATNKTLLENMTQLTYTYEQTKKTVNRIQQQRQDLSYAKEQLEIKLKHTERKCEQFQKLLDEKDKLQERNIELEEIQVQAKRSIKEKEHQIEKYRKIINDQNQRKVGSEKQQIKLLKEEIWKKQFILKQLNTKMNVLQEELRQGQRNHSEERDRMAQKIKQLEEIIQQRFDITARIADSFV